jgi:hypothetical protein
MKRPYLGIWVDHTQAYLIWLDEQGQAEVQHTVAEPIEGKSKATQVRSGPTGVYGALAPHATMDEKKHEHAKHLYDRLIKTMLSANRVYILGPGQARKELQKRLSQHKDFTGRIVAVDGAEKMTEAQMVAQVRKAFQLPRVTA